MDEAAGMQQNIATSDGNPVPAQDVSEKMLKQSEVNELIGKAKHAAYEKGKREALDVMPTQSSQSSMGHMPQVTEDQIRQMIADEAQRQAQVTQAHEVLNNFAQQMGSGKGKYSDFDETVANLGDLKNISHVVHLATDTGMAGDVMYELGKNPSKVASLTTLAYINPHLAKIEMNKLADSIKLNDSAKQSQSIAEPLSQVKPSIVGTDNGSLQVRDLRRKNWARA